MKQHHKLLGFAIAMAAATVFATAGPTTQSGGVPVVNSKVMVDIGFGAGNIAVVELSDNTLVATLVAIPIMVQAEKPGPTTAPASFQEGGVAVPAVSPDWHVVGFTTGPNITIARTSTDPGNITDYHQVIPARDAGGGLTNNTSIMIDLTIGGSNPSYFSTA